jgi:branched-chain amino acid transport system substrate-binding protein
MATSAGARAEDLVVGVEQALTGPYAFVGVPDLNATRLAADEINASGVLGANKIVLQVEDTGSDRTQAVTVMNKLGADPKVLIVIGPTSTIEGMAAAPAAAESKVTMFTTAISAEVLKSGPYIYKGSLEPAQFMNDFAEFAVQKLGVKHCALMYNRSNDANVAQKNVVHAYFAAHGVEIVSEDGYLGTDTDFSALATKVVSLKPDCVQLDGQATNTGPVVRQLRQAGIPDDVKILGTSTETTQQFLDIAGGAANGVYSVADFVPGGRDEAGKTFVADYQKRFKASADNYAAISYNMMKIVGIALQKAGPAPTRDQVRQAMENIGTVPTILGNGTFSIDADHRVHYKPAVMQVVGGKFTPVPN